MGVRRGGDGMKPGLCSPAGKEGKWVGIVPAAALEILLERSVQELPV